MTHSGEWWELYEIGLDYGVRLKAERRIREAIQRFTLLRTGPTA